MFIQTEQTPNPQTLKFLPGKVVMDDGTAFFQNIGEAANSPFAKRLFDVEGVEGVFFGSDFITITKGQSLDWQVMKPLILGSIMDHYNSGEETITITKKRANVIAEEKPIPAAYLFASKAFTYTLCIGLVTILIAERTWFINYFGSEANDIALTPASLAPSITLIIVSATAFSSAWITTDP